jgi:predicted signal transduction protein with EAL and GGDEF domain
VVAASGIREVLAGETVLSGLEYPCSTPSLDRWFLLRVTALGGSGGGAVASHVNIKRLKRLEATLEHDATHDPLTGLANRVLFSSKLTLALTSRPGRSDDGGVGVFYIDLDNSKELNDLYGHAVGDEVLVNV